jgi:hypothetical protein
VRSRFFWFAHVLIGKPVSTHSASKTRVNTLVIKSGASLFRDMRYGSHKAEALIASRNACSFSNSPTGPFSFLPALSNSQYQS